MAVAGSYPRRANETRMNPRPESVNAARLQPHGVLVSNLIRCQRLSSLCSIMAHLLMNINYLTDINTAM